MSKFILSVYGDQYPICIHQYQPVPRFSIATEDCPATQFESAAEAVDAANELGLGAYDYEVLPAGMDLLVGGAK